LKYEKFSSVEYTFLKTNGIYQQKGLQEEDFQTALRAAGETETTQENIQDWLELDEGDRGFQFVFL
jgi:hypothetical protein